MRAKPKRQTSPVWPAVVPVQFTEKQEQRLLWVLDRHKGADALTAIALAVGEYHAAVAVAKSYPSSASLLAELNQLAPKLNAADLELQALSTSTRLRIKNAYVEANVKAYADKPYVYGVMVCPMDADHAQAIDRAIGSMSLLRLAVTRAIANVPKERRRRPPSLVHVLIRELADLFTQHDRADHDNEIERADSRNAFLAHVLRFAKIPAPKRLTPILNRK